MRYLDTGSRDPNDALGTWMAQVVAGNVAVTEVRIQTGYFGADTLGYLEATLSQLSNSDGHTRILVGSNGGQTPRAVVSDLLRVLGPSRAGLRVGVVHFRGGLFHPKVLHFTRADGTSAAYVGSANLTVPGVTGQNIEAGITLDSDMRDPQTVLDEIAAAIDQWLAGQPAGVYPVSVDADLDPLVANGLLNVPPPPRAPSPPAPPSNAGASPSPPAVLVPLVLPPALKTPLTPIAPQRAAPTAPTNLGAAGIVPATVVKRWYKKLTPGNVDRLSSGHPQASMTLTKGPGMTGHGRHPIDSKTYFRDVFFVDAPWSPSLDGRGEVAEITASVVVDGAPHGTYRFELSHRSDLHNDRGNRTVFLRWGPLTTYLRHQRDHSGDVVTIEKLSDATYRITFAGTPTGPFIA